MLPGPRQGLRPCACKALMRHAACLPLPQGPSRGRRYAGPCPHAIGARLAWHLFMRLRRPGGQSCLTGVRPA